MGKMPQKLEYVRLAELIRGFEGKWVAISGQQVVAAHETADQLILTLQIKSMMDALILRVPAEDEPEMVGLG